MIWTKNTFLFITTLITTISMVPNKAAAENASNFKTSQQASRLLNKYCIDCHESDNDKGGIQLDNLSEIPLKTRLEVLNKVEAQLFSHIMPPKKKKQPTDEERIALLEWVSQDLERHKASELYSKLKLYRYGNLVPHHKLFSGEIKDTPYTNSRYWRINEYIYNERVKTVFGTSSGHIKTPRHDSSDEAQGRDLDDKAIIGLPIIFKLSEESGVSYYDNEVISGSHFMGLKKNADWIVDVQLRPTLKEMGVYQYPKGYEKIRPRYRRQKYIQYFFNIKKTPAPIAKVLKASGTPSDTDFKDAINFQFQAALQRDAKPEEMKRYLTFIKDNTKIGGHIEALRKTLACILMEPEFFYRSEVGENGKLTPREASYAISYALTDCVPDPELVAAAQNGKLKTKADYEREIRRILKDDKIAKPRILRFFRDYFGYMKVKKIFKDEDRFEAAYNPRKGVSYKFEWKVPGKVIDDADTFVKHILKSDKDVFERLLTSDKYFMVHDGVNNKDPKELLEYTKREIAAYKYAKSKFSQTKKMYKGARKALKREIVRKFNIKIRGAESIENTYAVWRIRYGKNADSMPLWIPDMSTSHYISLYNIDYQKWSYEPKQPFKVDNRMGMLTHPAWLISHAQNCHSDPVVRGKWIQEKLLGGFIPDVPITVDAQIPNDHDKTIRERFAVTEAKDCWGCHKKMNPLGNTFENYDDFGRYRTEEPLVHEDNIVKTVNVYRRNNYGEKPYVKKIYKTKPVDSSGFLKGTGDKNLDGEVKDAQDLISRLAKSERVRQVFVRNVFRYFMGRNEMLSDSKTLIEADKAYVKSGGSFKELMVSILTSDSFINRKSTENTLSKN